MARKLGATLLTIRSSLSLLVGIVALSVGAVAVLAVASSANASEGELARDRCAYRSSETGYRYIPVSSPPELTVESKTAQWMITGRSQWNSSGTAATTYASKGTISTPQRFRVYRYNLADGNIAAFGSGGCSPLGGEWTNESAVKFNENYYNGYTIGEMRNVAVHEFGHATGLAHAGQACSGSTSLSVMASGPTSYNCSGTYGPYSRDEAAALRIKNRGRMYFRNGLTTGTVGNYPYATEADDRVFRGQYSGTSDEFGIYDYDRFGSDAGEKNGIIFSSNGVNALAHFNETLKVGYSYDYPSYVLATNHDGTGADGLATYVNGIWRIASNWLGDTGGLFYFGDYGDIPVMGDWDCDGDETVGVFRPSTGQWFLRNYNSSGGANLSFYYGNPGDTPVWGDWDSSSCGTEIGVVRGRTWYVRSPLSAGSATYTFNFPTSGSYSGMQPLLGDWDGDGDETPGYYR